MEEVDGGSREYIMKGYNDVIKSNKIVYFHYDNYYYNFKCKLKDGKLRIKCNGGDYSARNNSCFKLDYEVTNLDCLKELQSIVEKYKISDKNGFYHHTDGLPCDCGDLIEIKYESGEKIYKESNQSPMISEKCFKEIYNIFLKLAKANDLDFTTSGSNGQIYDDATKEYLQGSWVGKHFGQHIRVTFDKDTITIDVENKTTDHTEYVIVKGKVKPKDGEIFNGVDYFIKKNKILLTGYFTQESYSTVELIREN